MSGLAMRHALELENVHPLIPHAALNILPPVSCTMHADSSDRVAGQLGLLITNIARFDFPGRSENLLSQLLNAASPDSQLPPGSRMRALKTLRNVLSGLSTKRFVIEPGRGGVNGAPTHGDATPCLDCVGS